MSRKEYSTSAEFEFSGMEKRWVAVVSSAQKGYLIQLAVASALVADLFEPRDYGSQPGVRPVVLVG